MVYSTRLGESSGARQLRRRSTSAAPDLSRFADSVLWPALCVRFAPGTAVPDATHAIYDALNIVHKQVVDHGPDAARRASLGIEPPAEEPRQAAG